jgi:phosphopantetheinyl transferase
MPSAPSRILLGRDPFGRPQALSADGEPLPLGLSFSRHSGWLWGAVAQTVSLGIDVSGPEDFLTPYPDARVFGFGELEAAAKFVASLPEARALLWGLKEAAAKALGTGFNKVEPSELSVRDLNPSDAGNIACRVDSPLGGFNALTGRLCGFRVAVATRIF